MTPSTRSEPTLPFPATAAAVAAALLVALGAAPGPASTPDTGLTLEELVRRHTVAVGGETALDSIRSLRADLRITEPAYTLDGVYRVDRRGRMRIDVFAGDERVYSEGYDGTRGWQMGPDSASLRETDPEATAALWRGTQYPNNVLSLADMEERGHDLELVGREAVAGTDYHVLRLTLSDGFTTRWYVHPETWLLERRRDIRSLHPDADPIERPIETVWSDFRPVAGVLRAHRSVQVELASGDTLQRTGVERFRVNPDPPATIFRPPRR